MKAAFGLMVPLTLARVQPVSSVLRVMITICALVCGACKSAPVLTQSQVRAAGQFAKAVDGYEELPGAVVREYADQRTAGTFLIARTADYADPKIAAGVWKNLPAALDEQRKYHDLARRADAAVNVIDTYAELVKVLGSDQFTTQLNASAERLSESLDGAIGFYNKEYRQQNKPLPLIGSSVAAGVRTAGGAYIRNRHAVLLRRHVEQADPVMRAISEDVVQVLNTVSKDAIGSANQTALDDLENRIGQAFTDAATQKQLPGMIDDFEAALRDIERTRALAKAASAAAVKLADSHKQLVQAFQEQKGVSATLEEIQALRQEVNAGRDLKKKLDEKGLRDDLN